MPISAIDIQKKEKASFARSLVVMKLTYLTSRTFKVNKVDFFCELVLIKGGRIREFPILTERIRASSSSQSVPEFHLTQGL